MWWKECARDPRHRPDYWTFLRRELMDAAGDLRGHQPGVGAFALQQLVVRACLDDPACVENHDLVGVANG